jgi:hypothetical protein
MLNDLKAACDKAETAFDAVAKRDYVDGRWGYYRAIECAQPVKSDLHCAFDVYYAALQAFYRMRDGDKGFLGARGA